VAQNHGNSSPGGHTTRSFHLGPTPLLALHSRVASSQSRLAWIDWMRGLACVLMFQTHCYDAWLGGDARNTSFLHWSQRLGTLPAPLFLFLAGISLALVTGKLIRKDLTPGQITRTMARRGAEIFIWGLLFRVQEYVIAWGWAPWTDLFRVDVLNVIGLSMILMALLCGVTLFLTQTPRDSNQVTSASDSHQVTPAPNSHQASALNSHRGRAALQGRVSRSESQRALAPVVVSAEPETRNPPRHSTLTLVLASLAVAALIALLTPPLYTNWRPTWLPWQIESYINGCHNLGAPQPWLFCIFPWTAFAFAGLAAGFILFSDWARERSTSILAAFAVVGAAAILVAYAFDHSSIQIYPIYDYWHTSPNFLMMRVGMLLMICFLAYVWCRWILASLGSWATRFSPLIQLGKTSLLVYWVHIEFVYGRFSFLPKHAQSIPSATVGLVEIIIFMLILSLLRTRIDWRNLAASLRSRQMPEPKAAE